MARTLHSMSLPSTDSVAAEVEEQAFRVIRALVDEGWFTEAEAQAVTEKLGLDA